MMQQHLQEAKDQDVGGDLALELQNSYKMSLKTTLIIMLMNVSIGNEIDLVPFQVPAPNIPFIPYPILSLPNSSLSKSYKSLA